MDAILQRCFRDRHFNMGMGSEAPDTSLWHYSASKIATKFYQLPAERRRKVRCMSGDHITYDVDTVFDRPVKFFTILRHPVDRIISSFYFSRRLTFLPCYRFIKDLTLEQYLDSGIGLDHDNHQVRMLSGCPELDTPWDPEGRPISTPPVRRPHLEMAKRNIEERFVVAAALEQFTALVWYLKRLYGWPLRRILFRRTNQSADRPKLEDVSKTTRKRLETLNQYDIELHEWVKARLVQQIAPLEPDFSREVREFDALNREYQRIDGLFLEPLRRAKHRTKSFVKLAVIPEAP